MRLLPRWLTRATRTSGPRSNRVDPATEGLEVEVVNFDDSLRLLNHSDQDVVIEGYEGEPYARVLADGSVELNRNSPAYYLNDDRFGESEVPDSADPEAEPDWELVDRSSMLEWHDHRMHWMSTAVPPQVKNESEETKIFDLRDPDRGGRRAGRDPRARSPGSGRTRAHFRSCPSWSECSAQAPGLCS